MENLIELLDACKEEKRELYPLTPSQMGIYLSCMHNPQGTPYNIPCIFRFDKGAIDLDRLKASVKKAVDNHPGMKVVIDNSTGSPMMKLRSDIDVDIPVIQVDDLEKAAEDFARPFDLEKDALVRFAVLECGDKDMFVMDFHHIIFDGTSVTVFCNDISLAYDGKELVPEKFTQLELSAFEEKLESTEAYRESKEYYDNIFSAVEEKSEITEDYAEKPELEDKPSRSFELTTEGRFSVDAVRSFAWGHNITPYTVFLGAYEYAVAKFTNQNEATVCTVTHGRFDKRLANTVGMMVRTLPMHADIDEEASVCDFLKNVRKSITETVKNDSYPFMKLAADYDLSADIMMAYQGSIIANTIKLDGQPFEIKLLPPKSAISKINVMVFESGEKFDLRFDYRSDLFREETIRSFADSMITIVEQFLKKEKLCEVELVSKQQLAVLDGFNKTEVPYDESKTIVDLFEESYKKAPDKIAVVYKEKKLTYAEVNDITDRIAGFVHSKGIGKEDVVAILIPRCEYMPIAALGVMKAGAAYQPLDPSYPTERLQFMVKDADAKLLIADEGLLELLPNYEGELLLTKDIPSLPKAAPMSDRPSPEDLFILIYTSGSTGTPKGAMLEHRNLHAMCRTHIRNYDVTADSIYAAYASYGFDACLMEMYCPIVAGAQLHIIDEDIRLDLVKLNRYFEDNGVTHVFMTTQVARQFATEIENHSLKYLITGGERLVPLEPPKNFVLVNIYGPTECIVYITSQKVDKLYDRVPVGKSVDNVKLYIIDKYKRRLPVGALGELCASGNQVSRGYLNRPEQTAKVYEKNPYCDEKGYERFYHTGDIVRFTDDGNVDYIGRNDGQVKIRGFRIELSEVDKIIRNYDGITNCAVVAKALEGGGQCINAYIVADSEIDIQKLNDFILEHKPPYMVPAATMQIDAIPLNVNGKLDRRKLPEIKADTSKKKNSAPRELTFLEKKISEIVEKVIGHNEFDVSENLIGAGMTSLSVIKLAVELNKAFGFEAQVKKMMKGCSVLSIEDELQEFMFSGAMKPQAAEKKEKKEHRDYYPLSKTQLGVYIDCMKNPYSTIYNIPSVITFSKSTDAQRLADCIAKIIKAHPYIMTGLTIENDEIEQKYVDSAEPEISVKNLTEEQLEEYKKDFVKPHNLMKSPLFRISVVETEKAVYLLWDFHHIIFDGASVALFLEQLKTLYEGGEIEPEDYTYFDYVEDEVKAENGESFKNAEKFFDDMMKDFESASEITADLRGHATDGRLASQAVPVDMERVEKFCSENGVTPAHLFLAGTFYAVSRFVNSRNVYISTISNGRSDIRLTNCFGMFVKTLALGIEVEDITSLEFVRRSKAVFTGAIENEIYPYTELCTKYGYAPNIMYEYQLGVVDEMKINGDAVLCDYLEMDTAKFKTAVHIEEHEGKPSVVVQYNDALYSGEIMKTLAKSVLCAVEHIIENPNGKIRKVSLLDDDALAQLDRFKSSEIVPVETKILHKMIEEQVAKTPERVALVACDGKLTYRELDRLANITANSLIERGLKKGGKVLLLLSRTSRFFTSLLGVLKAGGAFIPSCPEYPKERIDSIIEDSNADFVITEGELLDRYERTVDVAELLSGTNDSNPNVDVQPEDLAYLIYTSGSTGKPKGVMLRHIGIANYLAYSKANIQGKKVIESCHTYGSVTTISFDLSLKETLLSFCHGLTLAFASDDQTLNPVALARFFKENDVDVFNSTPSRLLQYMELDEFTQAMANCKVILSGGEKYPDKLLKILREKTNATIINTYGPTEITVSSNAKDLTNADAITVGRPLRNYTEYIVDADDNLLPVGVVGELLIQGCGVALGYMNLPEQTAKSFVEFKGERTYRSGDYAKWTTDGDVVILGRTDNQVKLRGLRIELGEIEKCLTALDGIKTGIALIRKVGKTDAICVYYTAERQLDPEDIKAQLKKTLTDYMVPSAYVQLDAMPLTPNGKVNTKALPEPKLDKTENGQLPKNELEKIFCDIFAEILELDTVFADENFFDIGGTSLTATRIVISASKKNIELAYNEVFENPTPQALARFISKDDSSKDDMENLSDYDYTNINELLKKNNLDSFRNGERQELGNVLLTGPAGFLGVHILYELLHKYNGKVYCLIRDKNNNPAESRLNSIYYYYFEESLKEKYPDRVFAADGDVTNRACFDELLDKDINTVINCAANVKHFSKGTDIEDVNLYGTLNVLDFCKAANARLVHVSTMSIGGMFVGEKGPVERLKEDQLYFGQYEGSKYTLSKFLAERAILEEASNGFNAKIMRVGTLAARNSDGEYQINFTTNTFMGRLKSTLLIGKYPYEAMEMPFELSPVDFVAKAILLLAQAPKECTVFHPFNNHTLIMGDLYTEMNKIGLHSEGAEHDEYMAALDKAEQDPEKAKILSSMIAYQNMAHGQKTFTVAKSNAYTMQVLYRMGFMWPVTSFDYMKRFINALRGLGFFD